MDAGIRNEIEYEIVSVYNSKQNFTDYFEVALDGTTSVIRATKTLDLEDESIQENYNFQFSLIAR